MAVSLAVLCTGCHEAEVAQPKPKKVEPRVVSVVEAHTERWPQTVRVQGTFLADERSVIGSKQAGRIEHITVDLGSVVRRGEPIVVLDRRELQLQIDQAEAQLKQACAAVGMTPSDSEAELDRQASPPVQLEQALVEEARSGLKRAEQLRQGSVITPNEYERSVAQLKTAEARLESALNRVGENIALIGVRRVELALARQRFEDAQIIAPFDAVVQQRFVSPGQFVEPGQQLVVIVRVDRLRFTAGVPESKSSLVHAGQTVVLRTPGGGEPITTTITRMSPMITQASRALWVEADVDNPNGNLQAGLFAQAEIIVNPDQKVLATPDSAIAEFAGVQKVWIVREGVAQQQTVRTGREAGGLVEILKGLEEGDQIIASATQAVDGPVIAQQESPGGASTISLP